MPAALGLEGTVVGLLLGPGDVRNEHLRNIGKYLPVQTVHGFSIVSNNTARGTSNFALVRSQLQFHLSNLIICISNHDLIDFFFQQLHFRVISGLYRGVDESSALLENYAALSASCLPTFRDKLSGATQSVPRRRD